MSTENQYETVKVQETVRKVPVGDAVSEYADYASETREVRDTTLSTYLNDLRFFLQWCEQNRIEFVCEVDGGDLSNYRQWRRESGNECRSGEHLSRKTHKEGQKNLQRFLRWCESVEYAPVGTWKKVSIPKASDKRPNQSVVERSDAVEMLEYLGKFDYASRKHVTILLLWETGARPGGVHALDIEHVDGNNKGGMVKFESQPNTRLKNGRQGAREVTITKKSHEVIQDYLKENRINTTDDDGRKPLLVARSGRIGKSTIRKYCYDISRPCVYADFCPDNRDQGQCPGYTERAHKCDHTFSPKAFRKGHITHCLRQGMDRDTLSQRVDASPGVIDDHYQNLSLAEEREERLAQFRDIQFH